MVVARVDSATHWNTSLVAHLLCERIAPLFENVQIIARAMSERCDKIAAMIRLTCGKRPLAGPNVAPATVLI